MSAVSGLIPGNRVDYLIGRIALFAPSVPPSAWLLITHQKTKIGNQGVMVPAIKTAPKMIRRVKFPGATHPVELGQKWSVP